MTDWLRLIWAALDDTRRCLVAVQVEDKEGRLSVWLCVCVPGKSENVTQSQSGTEMRFKSDQQRVKTTSRGRGEEK